MAAIYVSTSYLRRKQLWKSLVNLQKEFDLPWIFIGDFNTILGGIIAFIYHIDLISKTFTTGKIHLICCICQHEGLNLLGEEEQDLQERDWIASYVIKRGWICVAIHLA